MSQSNLRAKLFMVVAAIVICSSLVIATVVSQRYGESLQQELIASSENVLHNTALEAADLILTNDLVSLQKMLDVEKDSHSAVAYLFVLRDGEVLAHTFESGVPKGLFSIHLAGESGPIAIVGEGNGEDKYLDFTLPILEGKAGILRLGVTTRNHESLQKSLLLQIVGLTLLVMLVALAASNFFIHAITRPLASLADQAQEMDETGLSKEITISGYREVENLAAAFNGMLGRVREYTEKIRSKNRELERAQNQTLQSLTMAREVAGMTSFQDVVAFLITHMRDIVSCQNIIIALLEPTHQKYIFVANESQVERYGEDSANELSAGLRGRDNIFFSSPGKEFSFLNGKLKGNQRLAVAPVRLGGQAIGAMFIACPGNCDCVGRDLKIIELILAQAVGPLWRTASQEAELESLKGNLNENPNFEGMVGKSPAIQGIFKLIADVAPFDASVLITGESGTGKEMVANAIHNRSPRASDPLVVINCSAYPASLLESELFGHEKGAFTGATGRKKGRFELADGGTVFLDEIGEITPSAQLKLLRVLQTREFELIGGDVTLKVDVRVVAATNRNLMADVESGAFREDLFYRLNVIPINMPTLIDRKSVV